MKNKIVTVVAALALMFAGEQVMAQSRSYHRHSVHHSYHGPSHHRSYHRHASYHHYNHGNRYHRVHRHSTTVHHH